MKKSLIVIEETNAGYSVYSPDLPGCISTGRTREEVQHNMREAIDFHLEGMRLDGMEEVATASALLAVGSFMTK